MAKTKAMNIYPKQWSFRRSENHNENLSLQQVNKGSTKVFKDYKNFLGHIIRFLILLPIYGYRYLISPFLPMACRFEPTCSAYAIEAIQTCGVFKGMTKAIFRLLRCHPWCMGGYDPVSPNKRYKKDDRY